MKLEVPSCYHLWRDYILVFKSFRFMFLFIHRPKKFVETNIWSNKYIFRQYILPSRVVFFWRHGISLWLVVYSFFPANLLHCVMIMTLRRNTMQWYQQHLEFRFSHMIDYNILQTRAYSEKESITQWSKHILSNIDVPLTRRHPYIKFTCVHFPSPSTWTFNLSPATHISKKKAMLCLLFTSLLQKKKHVQHSSSNPNQNDSNT